MLALRVKVYGETPVTLAHGKNKATLCSGVEATCLRQKPTEMQTLSSDGIRRRKMFAQDLDNRDTVILSEFSIPSMLSAYS